MSPGSSVIVRVGGSSFNGKRGRVEVVHPAQTGAVNVGVFFPGDPRPVFFGEQALVCVDPDPHHAGAE